MIIVSVTGLSYIVFNALLNIKGFFNYFLNWVAVFIVLNLISKFAFWGNLEGFLVAAIPIVVVGTPASLLIDLAFGKAGDRKFLVGAVLFILFCVMFAAGYVLYSKGFRIIPFL